MSENSSGDAGDRSSRAVVVRGLEVTAETMDEVEMYFQKRDSHGGEVESVERVDHSTMKLVFVSSAREGETET